MTAPKITHLILDSAPIINGTLDRQLATSFYTVQEVLNEISDKRSKEFLTNLHLDLQILKPSPVSLGEIIEFSKATGDFPSLSLTDIKVMALTLDLAKKHQPQTLRLASQPISTAIPQASEAEERDPEDDWITPQNIKKCSPVEEPKDLTVACACNDFAMQNTMIHKGLNVINASGVAIKELKSFILRCHACCEIVKDMTKQFCPTCGRDCLRKVSYAIDGESGKMQIFLKSNFQHNLRGTKYSIPNPLKEKLIFSEDQKEYQMKYRKMKKDSKSVFDPDYVFAEGEDKSKTFSVMIGHGKKNVNQVRR